MTITKPLNIPFEKSETRHDGSASSDSNAKRQQHIGSAHRPPDIDVMSMISPSQLQEARRFIDGLHFAITKRLKSQEGRAKKMTDNLSHSVQVMKTNPSYSYARICQENIDDIPFDLKRGFEKFPSVGFICECRAKDISLGMGLSESKAGAKSKATEQAVSLLAAMRVTVEPVQRRWKDQNYPDLVLTIAGMIRENMPSFFSPPVSTDDLRVEQDRMKSNKKPKPEAFKSSSWESPDVNHFGPRISGKGMEHFVILRRSEDNPLCVLSSSAEFCKMGVDFYFEKDDEEQFICTLLIEGHAVADGKGVNKRTLKLAVADRALECLSKKCRTVVMTDGLTRGRIIYRKDVKKEGKHEELKPKAVEENSVVMKMMKMMGWKDGEGLGAGSTGNVEPVKMKGNFNRVGLGSRVIDSGNITREDATTMIQNYVKSDSVEELTFSSELNYEERLELKMMAKRYGLSERTFKDRYSGRKRTFLVLSKKIGPEMLLEQLEKEGKWGRYQLVRPQGGERNVITKYLNYQDKRESQGTPPQITNLHSDAGMERDIRNPSGFINYGGGANGEYHENKPGGWNENRFECGGDRFAGGPGASFGRGGGHVPFGRGGGLSRRGEQSREAGGGIRPLSFKGGKAELKECNQEIQVHDKITSVRGAEVVPVDNTKVAVDEIGVEKFDFFKIGNEENMDKGDEIIAVSMDGQEEAATCKSSSRVETDPGIGFSTIESLRNGNEGKANYINYNNDAGDGNRIVVRARLKGKSGLVNESLLSYHKKEASDGKGQEKIMATGEKDYVVEASRTNQEENLVVGKSKPYSRRKKGANKNKMIQSGWKLGDAVVAQWEDGVWRQGVLHEVVDDVAFVVSRVEMVKATKVSLAKLRHITIPVDVLNMLEEELVNGNGNESSCTEESVSHFNFSCDKEAEVGNSSEALDDLLALLPLIDIETLSSPSYTDLISTLVLVIPTLPVNQLDMLVETMVMHDLLIPAALRTETSVFARELVRSVMNSTSDKREKVLHNLALHADEMQFNVCGKEVLKTLQRYI